MKHKQYLTFWQKSQFLVWAQNLSPHFDKNLTFLPNEQLCEIAKKLQGSQTSKMKFLAR